MRRTVALASCIVALVLVNVLIAQKERLLADGRVVYLELAPVDPRSLMQGDYMALRFRVANDARPSMTPDDWRTADGHLVVNVDERSVGHFARLGDGRALGPREVRLRYRVRESELRFATNAFFFQEGTGHLYEGAHYGEFRVADDGDLLLTALRGANLELLGPQGR